MKTLLLALIIFLTPSLAGASLVWHTLSLTVNEIQDGSGGPLTECRRQPGLPSFECVPGQEYVGRFAVDHTALALEGDNLAVLVKGLFIAIGDIIWTQDFQSYLQAFSTLDSGSFGSPSFNFAIHDGAVTGIRGAVHGGADVPWLQFSRGDVFFAQDFFGSYIIGEYDIALAQIPEPASLLLLGFGLVVLARVVRGIRRAGGFFWPSQTQ